MSIDGRFNIILSLHKSFKEQLAFLFSNNFRFVVSLGSADFLKLNVFLNDPLVKLQKLLKSQICIEVTVQLNACVIIVNGIFAETSAAEDGHQEFTKHLNNDGVKNVDQHDDNEDGQVYLAVN